MIHQHLPTTNPGPRPSQALYLQCPRRARLAADQARETLKEYAERQEGWVTKDQVNDLITEHVDEELDKLDWEERVKDVLRDML